MMKKAVPGRGWRHGSYHSYADRLGIYGRKIPRIRFSYCHDRHSDHHTDIEQYHCRAQANDGSVQKKKTAGDKIYMYGSFLFTAVILAGVTFMLFTGNATPVMHEDSIEIQVSYWADKEVPYDSIRSVKLAEDLQRGSRKNGVGGPTLQAGHYKNGEFGDYMLYSYTSCDTFVVLDTEQGIVVLNGKDDAATRKLYSDIQTAVDRGFSLPIQ